MNIKMKYIDFKDKNLSIRLTVISLLIIAMYYWSPMITMEIVTDIGFYQDYKLTDKQIILELISTLIMIMFISIIILFYKRTNMDFLNLEKTKKINKNISNVTTLIMVISSFPLIFFYISGVGGDREALYSIIEPIRQNVFMSIVFSLSLASSSIELYYGNKRNILILFFIGIFPELLYGTRIAVFRFLFLLGVLFKWNTKIIIVSVLLFILIGMSRAFFTGYSSTSLYDFVILFLGDPINIYLGTSKIVQMSNLSCGIDGLHWLKPFTFPFVVRPFFDDYMGDLVYCMSKVGVSGLGNTLANELFIAPFSVLFSFIVLILSFILIKLRRLNPLINLYFILMIISAIPYIMRNGFIATVNHILTIFIWGIIPLFIIIATKNKYFSKDREKYNEL